LEELTVFVILVQVDASASWTKFIHPEDEGSKFLRNIGTDLP
jgi:hypothetical protein